MLHRRRVPLKVDALANGSGRSSSKEDDPFADVQLDRIVKELSFIRIQLDEITLAQPNAFIQKIHAARQLFGFQLEYSFPCLEGVSKALSSTVRIPEKSATSTKIEFKHKRVVLLSMHEDQVAMWQRARLNVHLLIQMESAGKHTTRPLAKCSIPLYELLIAPYMICRDFDFVGPEFEGSALLRIDLGTRVKPLMEKLESLRGDRPTPDETFVVIERNPGGRTRSRSSSRCRSHASQSVEVVENENVAPAARNYTRRTDSARSDSSAPMYDRGMAASTSSIGSDSVFQRPVNQRPQQPMDGYIPMPDRIMKPWSSARSSSMSDEIILEGKCHIELTVHEATGLPPVEDDHGRIVSPNSFVSVLGREGELRSEIATSTRQPKWNWTARFAMSSERRNLVVKVLHRATNGADKALGFVTLTLPVSTTRRSVFEMTDVSRMNKFTSDVPLIVMSIQKVRDVDEREQFLQEISRRSSSRSSTTTSTGSTIRRHQSTQSSPPIHRIESPPILESSDELKERLRRNMAELGDMMKGFQLDRR